MGEKKLSEGRSRVRQNAGDLLTSASATLGEAFPHSGECGYVERDLESNAAATIPAVSTRRTRGPNVNVSQPACNAA